MQVTHTAEAGDVAAFLKTLPEDEQLVAERYLRPSRNKELVFEFTRDPGYLHQYYLLRAKAQVSVWGAQAPENVEDEMDRQSHILIARRGNQVMAGGRMTISSPRRPMLLPLEQNGPNLVQTFPQLNLENRKYAEISRVAVEVEFQNEDSLPTIFQHFYRKIVATRVEYLFGLASAGVTNSYQRFAVAAGLNLTIMANVAEEDGIRMNLVMAPVALTDLPAERPVEDETSRTAVSIW